MRFAHRLMAGGAVLLIRFQFAGFYFSRIRFCLFSEIRHYCQTNQELRRWIRLLTTIPGIGVIVATHLVARLGGPALITNVREIAGFLGLVSSEHSTGDKQNRGAITRAGDSRLRNKLIQSAWVTIRKDPELCQHDNASLEKTTCIEPR